VTAKLVSLFLVMALLCGCPHNTPGPNDPAKPDPYATARLVIQGCQLSLYVADGVFEGWAAQQTDMEKVKKARAEYMRIRAAVADGLKLALDGVAIAEQAHVDPDLTKILAKADAAWQDLKALLTDILGKTTTPSTMPGAAPISKYKPLTVADLPDSLIPVPAPVKK